MFETISTPSINPADTSSEAGVLEFLQKKILSRIEKVAPAQVVEYDRTTNRATLQILPYELTTDGDKLTRPQLVNIPILTLSGGGFWFGFPVAIGDIGWIVACDRDISVFKQQLAEYSPNTYRKHKYDDSFFIPDKINEYTIAEDDATAVLISSLDGTTRISIKDGQVTITTANVVVNSTATEVNAETATVTAETTINGNLTVNGDVTINGSATASGDVIGAGISLSGHIHGGVTGGSGTTGTPQ